MLNINYGFSNSANIFIISDFYPGMRTTAYLICFGLAFSIVVRTAQQAFNFHVSCLPAREKHAVYAEI